MSEKDADIFKATETSSARTALLNDSERELAIKIRLPSNPVLTKHSLDELQSNLRD